MLLNLRPVPPSRWSTPRPQAAAAAYAQYNVRASVPPAGVQSGGEVLCRINVFTTCRRAGEAREAPPTHLRQLSTIQRLHAPSKQPSRFRFDSRARSVLRIRTSPHLKGRCLQLAGAGGAGEASACPRLPASGCAALAFARGRHDAIPQQHVRFVGEHAGICRTPPPVHLMGHCYLPHGLEACVSRGLERYGGVCLAHTGQVYAGACRGKNGYAGVRCGQLGASRGVQGCVPLPCLSLKAPLCLRIL